MHLSKQLTSLLILSLRINSTHSRRCYIKVSNDSPDDDSVDNIIQCSPTVIPSTFPSSMSVDGSRIPTYTSSSNVEDNQDIVTMEISPDGTVKGISQSEDDELDTRSVQPGASAFHYYKNLRHGRIFIAMSVLANVIL